MNRSNDMNKSIIVVVIATLILAVIFSSAYTSVLFAKKVKSGYTCQGMGGGVSKCCYSLADDKGTKTISDDTAGIFCETCTYHGGGVTICDDPEPGNAGKVPDDVASPDNGGVLEQPETSTNGKGISIPNDGGVLDESQTQTPTTKNDANVPLDDEVLKE